jgi:hypothetical protein
MSRKKSIEYLHSAESGVIGEKMCRRLDIEMPRGGCYVSKGWATVVEDALRRLIVAGWDKDLAQIKQKFCQLRIYLDGNHTKEFQDIIDSAVSVCDGICERCGEEREKKGSSLGLAFCNKCEQSTK